MSEDLERALRARKEFDVERDKRLEERWQAQDRSVTERFQAQERSVAVQLSDMRRRIKALEESQNRLIGLALGAPIVTAIIVYLLTRSGTG